MSNNLGWLNITMAQSHATILKPLLQLLDLHMSLPLVYAQHTFLRTRASLLEIGSSRGNIWSVYAHKSEDRLCMSK